MQAIISWVMGHEAIVAGFVVASADLVIALVPSVESNGVFHMVYLWVKGFAGKSTPPVA